MPGSTTRSATIHCVSGPIRFVIPDVQVFDREVMPVDGNFRRARRLRSPDDANAD